MKYGEIHARGRKLMIRLLCLHVCDGIAAISKINRKSLHIFAKYFVFDLMSRDINQQLFLIRFTVMASDSRNHIVRNSTTNNEHTHSNLNTEISGECYNVITAINCHCFSSHSLFGAFIFCIALSLEV